MAEADRLTLAEAAERLGQSKDVVRRRLKRGELTGCRVITRYGPEWRVNLDAPATVDAGVNAGVDDSGAGVATPATTVTPESGSPDPTTLELVRVVERLHGEVGQLQADLRAQAEAAAMWQERANTLNDQLQQLRALPAPSAPPQPWWRRWWTLVVL